MKTIGLSMITNDAVGAQKVMEQAAPYVDKFFITVADKTKKELKKFDKEDNKLVLSYFEWTADFAEARNANLDTITTDYFFWIDTGDEFDFSTLPSLLKMAEERNLEAIYLPYNYARDEDGRLIAVHSRERFVKTDTGFRWRGALHETLIIDRQFSATRLDAPAIEHVESNIQASIERNHEILLRKAQERPVDPRYLHYLGLSYFTIGNYTKCIEVMEDYIKVGGWDEEIYRSLIKMSEAASLLNNYEDGMNFALQAAGVMPDYPQAYFCLAQYEFGESNWKQCLEWLKVAFAKPQPKTMSVVDPTILERGKIIGASAEFQLGNYRDAEALLKTADDPAVKELAPMFQLEASKERFIEIAPAITKHVDKKVLWNGLQEDLKYDQRLKWLRYAANEPKIWPKKSIVWFVGQGYEEWGPHTLDKGMGGSEEAVINLSREFAKLGHDVTVYGAVNAPTVDPIAGEYGGVKYLPWRMFDTRDEFDTLIVWRAPHGIDKLNAKHKILDVHDKLEAKDLPLYPDVKYHFKSNYHRELYPHIPDVQAVVIGNGIVRSQFHG